MLVLSRKKNEVICIAGGIEILVVDIRGDKVRIGVRAPSDVAVHRKEIQAIIDAQLAQAAALEKQAEPGPSHEPQ